MSTEEIRDIEDDDAEGHMPRVKIVAPADEDGEDTQDTEGHMPRIRIVEPAGTDDTEGHGLSARG